MGCSALCSNSSWCHSHLKAWFCLWSFKNTENVRFLQKQRDSTCCDAAELIFIIIIIVRETNSSLELWWDSMTSVLCEPHSWSVVALSVSLVLFSTLPLLPPPPRSSSPPPLFCISPLSFSWKSPETQRELPRCLPHKQTWVAVSSVLSLADSLTFMLEINTSCFVTKQREKSSHV